MRPHLHRFYLRRYGQQAEPQLRQALVTRLRHERHLGGLLGGISLRGTPRAAGLIPDETPTLPDGITWNLSSQAQTLDRTPVEWFEGIVRGLLAGTRRRTVKDIYLETRRMVALDGDRPDLPPG